jgi:5'-nucleotidase
MADGSEGPLILVSNDDGVHARGIEALRRALAPLGRVVTVAPEREHSAGSHAITLSRPLRHRLLAEDVHAIDGTPVDCVYVALHHHALLPREPDLLVSGINHGPNLGLDVFYSGTVAAAREAALRGIPSMALSMVSRGDMEAAADHAKQMARRLLEAEQPGGPRVLLNVNFPGPEPAGVRATRLGRRHYSEGVDIRQDPRGREYFWIGGPGGAHHPPIEGADTEAVDQGFVSVTPLLIRATNPEHMGLAAYVAGPAAEES